MTLNQNQFAQIPVQGQVDLLGFGSNVISGQISANESATLVAGQAVKMEDTAGGVPKFVALAADTDIPFGFITYNVKNTSYVANDRVEIALFGSIMYMTAGAAIARGANIEIDVSETTVITAAGTNPTCGFAYDKAAALGDLIRVYILSAQQTGSEEISDINGLQAALNALNAPVLPYEVETAITTVGAGTLTAAGIVGKLIKRSGSTAAYSDATDTAVAIVAALDTYVAGSSFEVKIHNSVAFPQTITAGVGVTLTGNVVIPANSVGTFLVTITSTTAVAIKGLGVSGFSTLPAAKFTTGTTTTTFAAGQLEGAANVVYTNTQGTPGSIATRTGTQMVAGIPNAQIGQSYNLRVVNGQGTGTLTITAGVDVTLTGTMTVAANTFRDFIATVTSATEVTIQNVGVGTFS